MIYKTNSGYGVNFNQIATKPINNRTHNGITYTVNSDGTITANGTATALSYYIILYPTERLVIGHKYLLRGCPQGGSSTSYYLAENTNAQVDYGSGKIWTFVSASASFQRQWVFYITNGTTVNNLTFSFQCFDLTQMFGSGNEPTTVAEFREMYSNDYYDYTLSQWQWSKKGKITSYPTPVIENGMTLLPIEHHIVGLAKRKDGETDFDGVQGYQYGYSLSLTKINSLPLNIPITFEIKYSSGKGQNWQFGFRPWYESIPSFDNSPRVPVPKSVYTETTYVGTFTLTEHCKAFILYLGGADTDEPANVYFDYVKMTYYDGATLIYNYAKRELPVGFVRLDYIESTGNQYIDTGIKPNDNTKIEVEWKANALDGLNFSGMVLSGYMGWAAFGYYGSTVGITAVLCKGTRQGAIIAADTQWHKISIENGKQQIDDTVANYTVSGLSTEISLYLFACHRDYEESAYTNNCQSIRYCKIYDNDTLVRNFIPCYRYSDGIEGLYDTVGKQFYTNQGTGRFLRGNIIDGGILNNGN